METKFTPGPWSERMIYGALRHINKNVEYDSFIDADGAEFLAFRSGGIEFPDVRVNPADSRLIAAAPEMYALLERLNDAMDAEADDPDAQPFAFVAIGALAAWEELRDRINGEPA